MSIFFKKLKRQFPKFCQSVDQDLIENENSYIVMFEFVEKVICEFKTDSNTKLVNDFSTFIDELFEIDDSEIKTLVLIEVFEHIYGDYKLFFHQFLSKFNINTQNIVKIYHDEYLVKNFN